MVEGRRDGIRRESGDSGKERSDDGVDEKSNRRNTCRDGKGEWGEKGVGGLGRSSFQMAVCRHGACRNQAAKAAAPHQHKKKTALRPRVGP